MNNIQAKKIDLIKRRTSTAEVEERSGLVFVKWDNGKDHPFNKYFYSALIGKRGAVRVYNVFGGFLKSDDKKMAKFHAKLGLMDLDIRGTVKLL